MWFIFWPDFGGGGGEADWQNAAPTGHEMPSRFRDLR